MAFNILKLHHKIQTGRLGNHLFVPGAQTPEIVKMVRETAPGIPIIASGGKTEESIRRTIQAGANAITYTPPTTQELFKSMMVNYRENSVTNTDFLPPDGDYREYLRSLGKALIQKAEE